MRRAAVLARDADVDVVMRCGLLRMMLASLACCYLHLLCCQACSMMLFMML
jgi:hypothetical protein